MKGKSYPIDWRLCRGMLSSPNVTWLCDGSNGNLAGTRVSSLFRSRTLHLNGNRGNEAVSKLDYVPLLELGSFYNFTPVPL